LTDAAGSTGSSIINASSGILKKVLGSGVITVTDQTTQLQLSSSAVATLVDGESTTGQSLIQAPSGAIKRLIAGSNITLDAATTPGGLIVNSTATGGIADAPSDGNLYGRKNAAWSVVPAGGGGSTPIYPSARGYEYDDFTGYIQSNNAPNGKLQWNLKNAAGGTAANADQTGTTAGGKGLGVWKFTVTNSGDLQMINQGPASGLPAAGIIVPGLGVCDVEFRIWISALPTGSDDLTVECGLGANAASNTTPYIADVISLFYYFGGGYTNWQLQTSKAGTKTLANTGVAVTAGAWWKLHLGMDAGWANITPTINGTAYTAATANIPTNNLTPFFRVYKGGGTTAISASIDYFYRDYQFAR